MTATAPLGVSALSASSGNDTVVRYENDKGESPNERLVTTPDGAPDCAPDGGPDGAPDGAPDGTPDGDDAKHRPMAPPIWGGWRTGCARTRTRAE